jgi:UDP-N-acetylmuramyl pentapeptide phosphotransferase/UDP-N-acetylglucosamine-1-phosphate transferase
VFAGLQSRRSPGGTSDAWASGRERVGASTRSFPAALRAARGDESHLGWGVFYVFDALIVAFFVTLGSIRLNIGGEDAGRRFARLRRADWVRQPNLRGLARAGGLGIAAGVLVAQYFRSLSGLPHATESAHMGLMLLACSMPVFVSGVADDFGRGIGIVARLLAAAGSAALAGLALDAWVVRLDSGPPGFWITYGGASVAFTIVAVSGLTHAFNIIDGFNGLAGGVAILVLSGLAIVAFKVGDVPVMTSALTLTGAVLGFMLLNFPRGLIYLGDCGAYLIGFFIAELAVLLVARNREVSAWFPVLLCSYPVFETLFTIYRRVLLRRVHPGTPDVAHLHHLIYKRLVRWLVGSRISGPRTRRNALTSPYLWIITSVGVFPAVLFWNRTVPLAAGALCFAMLYVYGYARIAHFRSPGWMIMHRRQTQAPPSSDS